MIGVEQELEVAISAADLKARIQDLAAQIDRDYRDQNPVLLGTLKGGFYDSYNNKLDKWTTGRVQFASKGFSNFFPYPEDYKSKVREFPLEPLKFSLKHPLKFKPFDHNYSIKSKYEFINAR